VWTLKRTARAIQHDFFATKREGFFDIFQKSVLMD